MRRARTGRHGLGEATRAATAARQLRAYTDCTGSMTLSLGAVRATSASVTTPIRRRPKPVTIGADDSLVLGSQSILATYDEEELPVEATASVEVDRAFFDDVDDEARADQVDGAIGELSQFHKTFGYYAQGVSVSTAVFPNGWRDRVVL